MAAFQRQSRESSYKVAPAPLLVAITADRSNCGHRLHPIPLLRALVLARGVVLIALGDALQHPLCALPLEGAGQGVGAILGGTLAFLLATVNRQTHGDPPPVVEADLEPLLQVAASAQLDNVANRLGRPSLAGYAWRGRENMAEVSADCDAVRNLNVFFRSLPIAIAARLQSG